ncbi:endonuclease/exonuclease/phosphatase family protein [Pararhodobacter sp. SW119]|uniref:endonuclease/exonuclease/phosphatase family protein n=1 Tax=Pararhodobacter sp. SW119 TaxID=2780075 RepID=UPI001AE0973E|nr:endonuclease/exonuclease/phosphatase family protein [Pararhodobacter sp. SW119]
MRIATFNVQNLRLRQSRGQPRFDGARDGDMPQDATPEGMALDLADRRLTAAVLAQADADIVCLQEVFDAATLDYFHDHLLRQTGARPWPHRVCLPGNDGGRNLAVMSRLPLEDVVSHATLRPRDLGLDEHPGARKDRPAFCRDCLSFSAGHVSFFAIHFKAPWPDADVAWQQRRLEALALRQLVEARFGGDREALWLILGDLNEPSSEPRAERAIAPLVTDFAVDLVARMSLPDRWTWLAPDGRTYARPDAMLAAPALAARWPLARPQALREGLGTEARRHAGPRLDAVGHHRPHASDHALLMLELPGA